MIATSRSAPSAAEPIILAGMHRSGTSLLTEVLDELGLFVGNKLDENHEATFFLTINNWLMRQAGGAWDHPEPFETFLKHEAFVDARARQIRQMLRMPRAIEYLGVADYVRLRDVARLDKPWGWKDPRNSFTLPVWLKLFPGAKLVAIHRHGADVAASLAVRAARITQEIAQDADGLGRWRWRLPLPNQSFARCLDPEEGLKLWLSYSEAVERHAAAMGENAFVMRYEDFLADPKPSLERLLAFVGLTPSNDRIARALARLEPQRAFSYRKDATLSAMAERHDGALKAFGY
jgi:hypothetical protein